MLCTVPCFQDDSYELHGGVMGNAPLDEVEEGAPRSSSKGLGFRSSWKQLEAAMH